MVLATGLVGWNGLFPKEAASAPHGFVCSGRAPGKEFSRPSRSSMADPLAVAEEVEAGSSGDV